ncbi:MAG: YceI family protein [Anaerolineales bacterium]|nr:YceI family protein [Anaerolineales bacterium]
MNKRNLAIGGAAAVLVIIVVVAILFSTVLRAPEEASGTIEAIPLALNTETPVPATEEPVEEPTEAPTDTPEPADEEVEAEPEPTKEPTATVEPTPEPTATATEIPSNPVIFTIDPSQSQVSFEIDEDLVGVRNTVVGVTDQVAGQMAFDITNLTSTQLGIIQINARTLVTDSEFRNRSIRNEILDTNNFEFITFTPTEITELPDSVAVDETVTFLVTGDLTIRDITQSVTFVVTVTVISETEIAGSASTIVSREAFSLTIPQVQDVANVEDEVELYIDFVATAAE